ncbi:MAG: TatD family nuclease-associated radical SAM protein [Elusimicrobiales bacterium]|nr:TatD family nuclease-associated radical SAM protein [Elusimicrobiales bacterium]
MEIQKPTVVYRYKNGLYVNLTNSCPTACSFCVKKTWKMDYRGSDLNLQGAEPSPAEVIALAKEQWAALPFEELVFCGYGEPTMRLEAMLTCARLIKNGRAEPLPRALKIRLNTNGLANAVWGRNVVPEMKGLIDSVHVSLNTSDPAQWLELMRPMEPWAATGFEKVKEFIRESSMLLPEAFATAVESEGIDTEKFKALAVQLGAEPRLRPRLEAEKAP